MKRYKLTIGITLVFILGVLVGILGTGLFFKYRLEHFRAGRPPRHMKALLMKRLSKELDLTAKQRIEIEEIVRSFEKKIFAVRLKYLPEIQQINDHRIEMMKEKLNHDQKEKLETFYRKLRRRIGKRGERRLFPAP